VKCEILDFNQARSLIGINEWQLFGSPGMSKYQIWDQIVYVWFIYIMCSKYLYSFYKYNYKYNDIHQYSKIST